MPQFQPKIQYKVQRNIPEFPLSFGAATNCRMILNSQLRSYFTSCSCANIKSALILVRPARKYCVSREGVLIQCSSDAGGWIGTQPLNQGFNRAFPNECIEGILFHQKSTESTAWKNCLFSISWLNNWEAPHLECLFQPVVTMTGTALNQTKSFSLSS